VNTREAVEHLSDKAHRTARSWYAGGAVAILAGGVVLTVAFIGVQWAMFDAASLKLAMLFGISASAGIVVPSTRTLLRKRLALSRTRWIEDLARVEGLNAKELEQYFTLDSW
jgi:hypothetical protein